MASEAVSSQWQERALLLLDKGRRGLVRIESKADFAQRLGISRQTLWRNKELFAKVDELLASQPLARRTPRKAAELRALELQVKLDKTERENGRLLSAFLHVCSRLQEEGLDPLVFVGPYAADFGLAGKRK